MQKARGESLKSPRGIIKKPTGLLKKARGLLGNRKYKLDKTISFVSQMSLINLILSAQNLSNHGNS